MKRAFLLIGGLLACAPAVAQDDADTAAPPALDLRVPQQKIDFASTDPDTNYRHDPPGTWYGDHSGRAMPDADERPAPTGDWQVHGAVEAGVGWSKRGGNSNWQAANINLDKTYTGDDGDTNRVNIDINVGRGEGPLFGPDYFYAPDYYVPGPGPYRRGPYRR